ncbi:MAG: hypothetical protein DRJ42_22740 [Deltaproteobacteria bacterium]|nr:MAG: hypothetical protein DRJ42_22740 [Deltaproteobacteria bacterium]
MDIQLRPPPIGTAHAPIKITGSGTLEMEDDGLHITGFAIAGSTGRTLGIVLGILTFSVVVTLMTSIFDLATRTSSVIAIAAAAPVFLAATRKAAKEGERVSQVFPWANVKKVTWDSGSECLVVVIKGMDPKGGLFILQPQDSELQRELEAKVA